jgi:hypothetical protein
MVRDARRRAPHHEGSSVFVTRDHRSSSLRRRAAPSRKDEAIERRSAVAAARQFQPVVQNRRIARRQGFCHCAQILDGFEALYRARIAVIFAGHVVMLQLLQDNIFPAAKFPGLKTPEAYGFGVSSIARGPGFRGRGWSPSMPLITTSRTLPASSPCRAIRSLHSDMIRSASCRILSSL